MIILETWTGSLYTLMPGDIIRVYGTDRNQKDGSAETSWGVVAQRSDESIVYLSRPLTRRVGAHAVAHAVLDAIRKEIKRKTGEGTPHIYIKASAFAEEEV